MHTYTPWRLLLPPQTRSIVHPQGPDGVDTPGNESSRHVPHTHTHTHTLTHTHTPVYLQTCADFVIFKGKQKEIESERSRVRKEKHPQTVRCHQKTLERTPSSSSGPLHILSSLSPSSHSFVWHAPLRWRHTLTRSSASSLDTCPGHLCTCTWAVCETRSRSLVWLSASERQILQRERYPPHPPLPPSLSLPPSQLHFPSALINPSLSPKARKKRSQPAARNGVSLSAAFCAATRQSVCHNIVTTFPQLIEEGHPPPLRCGKVFDRHSKAIRSHFCKITEYLGIIFKNTEIK